MYPLSRRVRRVSNFFLLFFFFCFFTNIQLVVSVCCCCYLDYESCDLFNGHWIRDWEQPFYTNKSCLTIPEPRNCFKNGRIDTDFLKWRWKPDACEIPRFNAKLFLQNFRGKSMAFIGDSVARNHMESLQCLLSQVGSFLFTRTIYFSFLLTDIAYFFPMNITMVNGTFYSKEWYRRFMYNFFNCNDVCKFNCKIY